MEEGKVTQMDISVLGRAEIDLQIATAKNYPRDPAKAIEQATQLVTRNVDFADQCIYAVPREDKGKVFMIEGPSARFAEVLASSWGNCRAGARVVGVEDEYVVAQGAFADLEHNVAITYEVKRRIVTREGRRYSTDMIQVTANAACSIALRNAVLKGIPKVFWQPAYEAARALIAAPEELTRRRALALDYLQATFGVTPAQVCTILQIEKVEQLGANQLVQLRGLVTALQDGEITVKEALEHTKPIPMPQPRAAARKRGKGAQPGAADRSTAPATPVEGAGTDAPQPARDAGATLSPAAPAAPGGAATQTTVGTEQRMAAAADTGSTSEAGKQPAPTVSGAAAAPTPQTKRINEKQYISMYQLVANRGKPFTDGEILRKFVWKVVQLHGFARPQDVTVDKYEQIRAELESEQP